MINFNIISPQGKGVDNLNTTQLKIKTPENSKVIYPIDNGRVISIKQDECGGNVIISFSYEGSTYLINFCGVSNIVTTEGSSIKEGDIIGITNDRKIYVHVLDSKNKKINLSRFKKDREEYDGRNYGNDGALETTLKTSLFPMSFAHDVVTDLLGLKPKLKEEITRIKELL